MDLRWRHCIFDNSHPRRHPDCSFTVLKFYLLSDIIQRCERSFLHRPDRNALVPTYPSTAMHSQCNESVRRCIGATDFRSTLQGCEYSIRVSSFRRGNLAIWLQKNDSIDRSDDASMTMTCCIMRHRMLSSFVNILQSCYKLVHPYQTTIWEGWTMSLSDAPIHQLESVQTHRHAIIL
jgi:hypothetical protein